MMPKRKDPPNREPDEDPPGLTIGQLRELGRHTHPLTLEEVTSAAAAAATRAVVEAIPALLRQMQMFTHADEPIESEEHCPGNFPDDWAEFRAVLVKYEHDLNADHVVFKREIADVKGCVVRTITRAMMWHGLDTQHWPPSSWPQQAPPRKSKQNHSVTITDPHAGILAAGLFGVALLDVFSDGKLDHVVRLLKMCGVRLVQM